LEEKKFESDLSETSKSEMQAQPDLQADIDSSVMPADSEIVTGEVQTAENQPSAWRTFFSETLQTIILAIVLYFLIDSVVARVRVENISMIPTLHAGEFVLVNKLAYRLGNANRGDIVVFHYPPNPTEDYIKRVIGLPGDTVKINNRQVSVNGQILGEAYISAEPTYQGEWVVPDDNLFVLGDNRNQSSDSHSWGFVPLENVVGKALVVYWPFNQMQLLNATPVVNASN
jgi:signal peptidase I